MAWNPGLLAGKGEPMSLYFFLGMVCFFLVSLTIIFSVEKRMAWPYGDL